MNKERTEIKLPRRVVDISALAAESAEPEEALLLLSTTTSQALLRLPDAARAEVRDLIYELGRAAQNASFPTLRVDLDLVLEPPQDWCAVTSLEGQEVGVFEHTEAETAFAMGVREAVIQATSMGFRPRSTMLYEWSVALRYVCGQLSELADEVLVAETVRDGVRATERMSRQVDLDLNPEGDVDG